MKNFEVNEVIDVPFCHVHGVPLINLGDKVGYCNNCHTTDTLEFVIKSADEVDFRATSTLRNGDSISWRFYQPTNENYNKGLIHISPRHKSASISYTRKFIPKAEFRLPIGRYDPISDYEMEQQRKKAITFVKYNCREWPVDYDLDVDIDRSNTYATLKWYWKKNAEVD